MLGYDNLRNHIKTNFALENMMPWERLIWIDLLQAYLKKQEEDARDRAAVEKRNRR
jgi:hypothetical protein